MAITWLTSCETNRYDVDLAGIESQVEVVRLESEFLAFNESSFEVQVQDLQEAHPLVMEVLIEQVLRAGRAGEPNFNVLKRFFLDSNFMAVARDAEEQYKDLSNIEKDLNLALRHVKYYYPEAEIPARFYTLITGFAVPGFTYENLMATSLDWYLGQGYEYYHQQVFPMYMQRRMTEPYIVPQLIKAYFTDRYDFEDQTDGTLLSEMIYWGKQLEFTKMMLPELNDTLILEYTAKNLSWCVDNEKMMFNHFVERKLWFETDQNTTYRYVSDGPYTVAPEVPIESAPRMGWFIGWQIVKGYLDNVKGDPVVQLFENTDAQDIFRKARYKP